MKKLSPFVWFVFLALAQPALRVGADGLRTDRLEFDSAIEKYVRFLETQHQPPVNYVLGLFEKNDLVVLCERAHAEVTQYDLIYELVSDPRFQDQVGHIFTEVGTCVLRASIESLLTNASSSEELVTEKLRDIAQNFDFTPVWEKSNIFDFLRRLQHLNRALPQERRVHVYPSGIEFTWENMTREKWAEFRKQLGRRDEIMAENIIRKFKELREEKPHAKALVIMNYRHAFPHLKGQTGRRVENSTGFLMDAFAGKVANVMINSVGLLPGTTDQRALLTPLQEGRWDAAFAVLGNPSVGFDFTGSPLGEDAFDYFPFIAHHLRYQDVFTGFVFYKSLEAHRQTVGLPGLIDMSFGEELMKRTAISGNPTQAEITRELERLGTAHISSGYDDATLDEKIRHWLKANL
jgi:hypothetical protein